MVREIKKVVTTCGLFWGRLIFEVYCFQFSLTSKTVYFCELNWNIDYFSVVKGLWNIFHQSICDLVMVPGGIYRNSASYTYFVNELHELASPQNRTVTDTSDYVNSNDNWNKHPKYICRESKFDKYDYTLTNHVTYNRQTLKLEFAQSLPL